MYDCIIMTLWIFTVVSFISFLRKQNSASMDSTLYLQDDIDDVTKAPTSIPFSRNSSSETFALAPNSRT